MPAALPELAWIGILLLSFAIVYTLRKFVRGLFAPLISILGHIPGVGGLLSSLLSDIEASISNALGSAESAIDRAIGASFHELAHLTDELWTQIRKHAHLLLTIASFIPGVGSAIAALRALVHHSAQVTHGLGHRVKTLEREWHGIEHRVKTLAHELHHGIGHDILPRLRSLDREVARLDNDVIPALRDAANTAEADVSDLHKWITQNVPLIGSTALVGAVAWALGRLGLGSLRCPSFANVTNKRGCGLWNDLDALLGAAFIAAEIASIYELIGVAQTVAEDVTRGVETLLDV